MTPRISKFVAHYLANGCKSATEAAIKAGYSKRSAYAQASRMMKNDEVLAAIQRVLGEQEKRTLVDRDAVLGNLGCIAFCDIADAFDDNGRLLPIDDMPDDVRRAIAHINVSQSPPTADKAGRARGASTTTYIRMWDKVRALELLGKHFRLFVDRVETTNTTDRASLLAAARERVGDMLRSESGQKKSKESL